MDNKSPEAFRTISEVADWLGVPAHVLRFWESRFGQVKPVKRAGGRRYYRPSDMELLGGIRKLLHEDGMTIRGVQKLLRENGVRYVAAMSPPIDQPGDLKDVSPGEDVAQDTTPEPPSRAPVRAAPVFDDEIEDAVEDAVEAETPPDSAPEAETPGISPEVSAETGSEDGAEDLPPSVMDSQAPAAVDPEVAAADEGAAMAEDAGTVSDDTPQEAPADDRTPVFESAAVEPPQEVTAGENEARETEVPEPGAQEFGAQESGDGPLDDSPEALDFLSHEAEPDTSEGPEDTAADRPENWPEDWREAATDAGDAATPHPADDAAPPAPVGENDGPVEEVADDVGDTGDDALPPGLAAAPFAPDPDHAVQETAQEDTTQGATAEGTPVTDAEDDAALGDEEPLEPLGETAPAAGIPASFDDTPVPDAAAPDIPPTLDAAVPDAATPDAATPPAEPAAPAPPAAPQPAPPKVPGPDLVLPDIGPDLEDDAALPAAPALAAALRRSRPLTHRPAAPAPLNPALLQAYADRLQALSGRLGATPNGRRPF